MTNSIALLNTSSETTMSSLEIAALTGKEHRNVLADIRNMLKKLDLTAAEFSAAVKYTGNNNAQLTREIFNLPKHECMVLVTGYSIKLRSAVLRRWQELEDAQRAPAAATKPLADMTKKELLMSLTELACDTEDMVHAMNGKLALGRFCTWTQYCKANAHLHAFRNPMTLCWMPAMIAARADIDGWETHTMGNQAATSALSPQTYPSHLLHDFVKHTLGSRDKYAHLAPQVVPYVSDITLEVPAATKVLLDRAKMVALQLRDMTNA